MKKIIFMFILSFSLICFASCGEETKEPTVEPTPTVEVTPTVEPTETPTSTPEVENYSVKVLFPDGTNPTSASGIKVQVCTSEGCQFPVGINDEGVAVLEDLEDNTYFVHLQKLPAGYTYNPNHTISPETKNVEITLIALNELTGAGTAADPHVVTTGGYSIDFSKSMDKHFLSFTPTEAGTYIIESLIQEVQSSNNIKPVIVLPDNTQIDCNKNENFKQSIVMEANKTYLFVITVIDDNTTFPANININITKA